MSLDFQSLATVSRRKLGEWCLGKRARAVGSFVVAQSFEKGRMGVRMYNRHVEAALGMDKGCVSDAITELVASGVLQVVGRSGSARVFRFLPNAELVEPESRVDPHARATAIAEIERINADGLQVEATGQRVMPIQTDDEVVDNDLAHGSMERALEDVDAPASNQSIRFKMIESFRSAGWDETEFDDAFSAGTNGAAPAACLQPVNNSPTGGGAVVSRGHSLGSQPSIYPPGQGNHLAESQALPSPIERPKAARTYTRAHAPDIGTIGNGATAPHWSQCGAVARKANGQNSRSQAKPHHRFDEDLLRRVEEAVGKENRGYWATILRGDGQPGVTALHEALGEFKLGGGAPQAANKSRYLFGIYRRFIK